MSANTFGERFRILSFGESHGTALGVVIDGCPAGVQWNESLLNRELERRRPGQKQEDRASIVTDRAERDLPEILSGVYEGKTLGTPIAMTVRNTDARSEDYKNLSPRTGHADDVWKNKFGVSDPRGGGRSSGRETVTRVMAGAVARMLLAQVAPGLGITGFMKQAGPLELTRTELMDFERLVASETASNSADRFVGRFPSEERQNALESLLTEAKAAGRSYGGTAEIWVDGVPANLGQPVFHKLKSDLAAAMMSLGATTGFEIGEGEPATRAEGSEFHGEGTVKPERYGGIRGGISTGERLIFRVFFKPTSSVLDVAKKGRHDPCIVPRAIPVLEAMTALVLADHWLWSRTDRV